MSEQDMLIRSLERRCQKPNFSITKSKAWRRLMKLKRRSKKKLKRAQAKADRLHQLKMKKRQGRMSVVAAAHHDYYIGGYGHAHQPNSTAKRVHSDPVVQRPAFFRRLRIEYEGGTAFALWKWHDGTKSCVSADHPFEWMAHKDPLWVKNELLRMDAKWFWESPGDTGQIGPHNVGPAQGEVVPCSGPACCA